MYQAQGSYTREKRYIILTAVERTQAVLLRNFVRSCEPEAFLIITNSSEVVGKGFLLE
ncbi:YitT family protein [Otoolea muris]|uniref:YitT family protein n=1 Tax=Otoolea muris TaxID=2941515 RepID=UPI003A7F2AD4